MVSASEPAGIEELILSCWRKVLAVNDFDAQLNFFELGGDSSQALEVVAQIQDALPIKVSLLGSFFEEPTVASLARAISDGLLRGEKKVHAKPVEKAGIQEAPLLPFHTNFLGAYDDFVKAHGPRPFDFTMPPKLYEAVPHLDRDALSKAAQAVVQHHGTLRTTFSRRGVGWKQIVSDSGEARVEHIECHHPIDLLELGPLVKFLPLTGWDIERGPLFRIRVVTGTDRTIVITTSHHLVSDNVSESVFERDLHTAYGQAVAGQEIRLPENTATVRHFAEHLRQTTLSEAELTYLKRCIAARPKVPWTHESSSGELSTRFIEARRLKESDRVRRRARSLSVAVIDVLLTAFVTSAARWAGEANVLLVHHGRSAGNGAIDLSRTAAPLVTDLPMLADIPTQLTARERIELVRTRRLSMRPELGYRADTSWSRLPHLSFNYTHRSKPTESAAVPDGLPRLRPFFPLGGPSLFPKNEFLCFWARNRLASVVTDIPGENMIFQLSCPMLAPLRELMDTYERELEAFC